jgi:hypothetical protein
MFILRGRFILIGLVVLIAWGCGVSNRYAPDDSSIDAAHDKQIESGVNDVGVIPQDATYDSQLESGVVDVGIIPREAASDVGTNTSITDARGDVDLKEIPDYATGKWRVVEIGCPPDDSCVYLNRFSPPQELFYRSGDVLIFKDGCLFGRVNCVEGLHYSEENITFMTRCISEGEYDPDTQRWQITRNVSIRAGSNPLTEDYQEVITLERELSDGDADI